MPELICRKAADVEVHDCDAEMIPLAALAGQSGTDVQSHESVLVIASNDTLRRSLAFLLEAEGYDVSSRESVPSLSAFEPRKRCAVVDEGSLDGAKDIWERLAGLADATVVLLSRAGELPADSLIHTVEKPLLGGDLVETVKTALVRSPALRTVP